MLFVAPYMEAASFAIGNEHVPGIGDLKNNIAIILQETCRINVLSKLKLNKNITSIKEKIHTRE